MVEEGGKEEIQIVKGLVAENGMEIVFKNTPPEWYEGPYLDNEMVSSSKLKWLWILVLGFFGTITIINSVGVFVGEISPILLVFWIGLSSFFTIAGYLSLSGSIRRPKRIHLETEGIKLLWGKDKTNTIPWSSVVDIIDTFEYNTLSWKKNDGTQVNTVMSRSCAFRVYNAVVRQRDFSKISSDPVFQVWNLAPPGRRVAVANKEFTDEELKYRKLRKRFLWNGIYTPVYVTEEDGTQILVDCIKKSSLSLDDLKRAGEIGLSYGLWKETSEIWNFASSIAPNDIKVMCNLAGSLVKSKKAKEGLEILDKALQLNPNSSEAMFFQSLAYYELGKVDEAEHILGKAVEANPNNADALLLWFEIVSSQGGFGQAVSEIDYLATTHNKAWGPYFVIGGVFHRMQKFDEAYRYYQDAVKREANETTLNATASVLIDMGKPKEASALLERHRSNFSSQSPILILLAHSWLIEGKKEKAQELLRSLDKAKDQFISSSIHQLRQQYGLDEN
ncbi:MAG: tetratricopeptide repeat protein [Thermoplasmata archaeon]|nr:tetratricopeptide repeat protein [Thermoplasmata archaeon]